VHRLQQLFQAGSESRSVGLDLSWRPPSAGQAPLAVLRGSLGPAYVQMLCVTDVGLVCVVERYDLTELLLLMQYMLSRHIFVLVHVSDYLSFTCTYKITLPDAVMLAELFTVVNFFQYISSVT